MGSWMEPFLYQAQSVSQQEPFWGLAAPLSVDVISLCCTGSLDTCFTSRHLNLNIFTWSWIPPHLFFWSPLEFVTSLSFPGQLSYFWILTQHSCIWMLCSWDLYCAKMPQDTLPISGSSQSLNLLDLQSKYSFLVASYIVATYDPPM